METFARSTVGKSNPSTALLVAHLVRQDLSIAGKRKGLAGERSGLFMEQIRIIKEMREHDRKTGRAGEFVRPRYMVWENVVGAQSSQKGRDFAAVLEETIRVAEPEAPDIQVPNNGWPTWGGYRDVDGRWSVAWRVLDAQWWGVPQRRRRIALVADFGGTTAHEILFNAKGVYGHPETGREEGERSSRGTEGGTSCTDRIRGGCDGGEKEALVQSERSGTLGTHNDQTLFRGVLTPWDSQANRVYGENGIWPSLQAREKSGQNRESVFCVPINDKATRFSGGGDTRKDDGAGNGLGVGHDGDPSPTLTAADRHGVYCAGFKLGNSEQSPTFNAECGGNKTAVVYSLDSLASNSMKSPNPNSGCREVEIAKTLDTTSPDPSKNQGGIAILDMSHANDVIRECGDVVPTLQSRMETGGNQVPLAYGVGNGQLNEAQCMATEKAQTLNTMHDAQAVMQNMAVRRLTPLECERLQGFPDGWTDIGAWTDDKGKLHKESSDSARYRALGNSIALPPWKWVLKRLCAQYERDASLGSLFDGLGGFPLLWMQLNGWNSVKWASEIEPFCIAVTKRHFGEEKNPGDVWKYLIGAQKDG